jgi:tetratricopeptide (TPR) repeat protein
VSNKYVRLLAAAAVLCLGHNGWGQNPKLECLQGEVHIDSPPGLRSSVVLIDLKTDRSLASADVGGDGRFEVCRVPDGEYRLTVLDDGGRRIYEELVSVRQETPPIAVEVERRENARPPGGSVSVNQLLDPPSRKALAAFAGARKLTDAGAYAKAAEELEKAVRISPSFVEAWVNLSAQHIHMGHYEEALAELSKASALAKPSAMIFGNMALAQLGLHRHEEAVQSARESLRLDPSYPQAHYVLGIVLSTDRRTLPEAIGHLEQAARSLPTAQVNLERARRDLAQAMAHP